MVRLFVQMSLELVVKYEKKEIIEGSQPVHLALPEHIIDGNIYSVPDF